jgi:bifunctional NMN adenylyltransferase/nudix hydrolase
MSKYTYDLAVFIGRMQPLHNGHIRNIKHALGIANHVLVIAGSANQPRTPKNPFTADERAQMVKTVFPTDRVSVAGVEDYYPDAEWLKQVQTVAHKYLIGAGFDNVLEAKVAILGHDKDHTSFYLSAFPTWKFIEIGHRVRAEGDKILDATIIRNHYFDGEFNEVVADVPTELLPFLDKFSKSKEYKTLVEELDYIRRYHEEWDAAPYPPTFVTTDAVVVQSGHVLLVKRKVAPGKGLWALPGGFVNQYERLEDGMVRELREETKLKIAPRTLKKSVEHFQVFDEPNRSLRGRTITNAYLVNLGVAPQLPKVKGDDDAEEARWFPLDLVDAMGSILFEDHKRIIDSMTAKIED